MRIRLSPGERVVVRTRADPARLAWPVAASVVLLGLGGFALGRLSTVLLPGELLAWRPVLVLLAAVLLLALLARLFVRPFVRWLNNRYVLTSMRLIHRRGAARRSEHQIPLSAVYQLDISQSLFQRFVGSGTLLVDLGRDRMVTYRNVPRIHVFKDYVVAAVSELPLTLMFDGVDMEIDSTYAQREDPGANQEWRGGGR
ncbi:PH domain-containing protein [Arthrobacter sp. CAN_A6]|uniref:PH domain-containing protein n=1 Tax=Arthrobacter sp. CAN_A6 TaxID=2787721 RepID=UPI0018CA1655